MILEAISISLNIGCFTSLVWSMFILQNANVITKIQALLLFLCYGLLFFFTFFLLFKYNEIKFFEVKEIYFSHTFIYIFIGCILFIFFLIDKKYKVFVSIVSVFLAPYIFFMIFGIEKYTFFNFRINSLSLLKAQNPLIFISCFSIYLLRSFKIQLIIFFSMLILLYYSIHTRKIELTIKEKEIIYSMYIPYEYFLSQDLMISELEKGMYVIKTDKFSDEILYRFSLSPVRNIQQPHKQTIQYFVSIMSFPIVINKKEEIILYDLSRSYNKNMMKVTYNSKIDKMLIEGPLF